MSRRLQSQGKAGEQAARYWFNTRRPTWCMEKIPAGTKALPGGRVIYQAGSARLPDYLGWTMPPEYLEVPVFRACEVKEAKGDSMPASRLSPQLREYMRACPLGTAWVFVLWSDGLGEGFPFQDSGSYKKGFGIK